jgi:hypothetical protein
MGRIHHSKDHGLQTTMRRHYGSQTAREYTTSKRHSRSRFVELLDARRRRGQHMHSETQPGHGSVRA